MLEKIKDLEYQIMDEVHGAEKYFVCSKKWVESNTEIAKKYKEMAGQELKHAEELHKMLLSLRESNGITSEDAYLIKFLADINVEQITRVTAE